MIRKRASVDGESVHVTFTVDNGAAPPVTLVGDFNDWDAGATPLEAQAEGGAFVTLTLPAGRSYEFRYQDGRGRWFNDEAADDYVDNQFGGINGVVQT